ncbi:mucin-binding protein [Lactobacillus helveticus]|uniref:mucin-binding protein n=1 Tax=Lactobacillus helveticus TaxID=1587 RepID=UPI0021AC6F1D|nr:hypothetical protein [Lactobacillus helveticus]
MPTSYTFKASDNEPVVVHLVHIKKTIEHTNPVPAADKIPTDKPIDGAHEDDLNKTITRTINVTDPEGTTKKTDQTATVYRNAVVDEVTGEVTYGDWSTGNWGSFTTPAIAGYTPNKQTTNIVYKDKDGQTIKTDKVDGKTDETIPVDPTKDVPAGWKIIPDQKIPETVKVTPDGVPTVVVKIEHKTRPLQ